MSKHMGPRQGVWNKAVQARVTSTSSILKEMKSIKLSGLASHVAVRIQSQRVAELELSKKFRILVVIINIIGKLAYSIC